MALGTAATIAGIASSAAGAGMSFAQANKQKKAMKAADAKAAQYMADARKRLEVNYMDELALNKEAYERERDANLVLGSQAINVFREADPRGTGQIGKVLAAQQRAQGDIRDQMNRDLFNLEAASAEEDSRLRDAQAQLDMGEAAGAQQASAEAAAARQAALSQGIQGATNAIAGAISLPSLYGKTEISAGDTVGDFLSTNPDFSAPSNAVVGNVAGNTPAGSLSQGPQMKQMTSIQNQGPFDFSQRPQMKEMVGTVDSLMNSPFMQQRTRGMVSPIPNQSFGNIQTIPLQNGINFFQY